MHYYMFIQVYVCGSAFMQTFVGRKMFVHRKSVMHIQHHFKVFNRNAIL